MFTKTPLKIDGQWACQDCLSPILSTRPQARPALRCEPCRRARWHATQAIKRPAHAAVARAIREGALAHPSKLECVDCGDQAAEYDHRFGPFTWSSGDYQWFGAVLDSGGSHEDSSNRGCRLRLHAFRQTLIVELPRLLPDFRIRHVAGWDEDTVARMGRNWYDEVFSREYGFVVTDGGETLYLYLGPQTHDSETTKRKCYSLPWANWRFIRHSWYGPTGQHIETLWETSSLEVRAAQWDWRREFEAALVKTCFECQDEDGTRVIASTHIEEREWRFGTGLFRWLSLFVKPKVRRSLDISFSAEFGPEKGSWKGGLMGTGIEMLPGELHEAAFRRFCNLEHSAKYRKFRLKFVGALTAAAQGD